MPVIPSTEPSLIIAGDTLQWTKSIPDYPAGDGWTLKYSLRLPGTTTSPISITATTDGDNYAVEVAASTTEDYAAGSYVWTSFVERGSERFTIDSGPVTILSDPEGATGTTHATRTLAIIELALENRLPRGMEMYTINGQQVQKMTHEALSRLRDKYKAEVKAEQDAARVASGQPSRRTIWTRFGRVS